MDNPMKNILPMLIQQMDIPDDAPANNVAEFIKELLETALLPVDEEILPVVEMCIQTGVLHANADPKKIMEKLLAANDAFVKFVNNNSSELAEMDQEPVE